MHAAVGIAQSRTGLGWHIALAVIPAGGRSRTAGALGDGLECLHMLEAAALVESFEGCHDAARIDLVHFVPAEAELFDIARADVLDEYVGILQQIGEDLLAFWILHVQCDGLLVGIELKEVQGIRSIHVVHFVTRRVSALNLLHLDDFSAHPGEHLRAGRTGLHLSPVDDLDSLEGSGILCHL